MDSETASNDEADAVLAASAPSLQERMAKYKRKLARRQKAQAEKDAEEQARRDARQKKRLANANKATSKIEEEARKTQQTLDDATEARDAKAARRAQRKEKKRLAALQRQYEDKTINAEHGVMMDVEKVFEKEEKATQERLETYKQNMEERKKKQADEEYAKLLQQSALKRKEQREDEDESRQLDYEIKAIKAKVEPTKKAKAKKLYTSAASSSSSGASGSSVPAWTKKDFLKNRRTKQERRMERYKELEEQSRASFGLKKQESMNEAEEAKQVELEEAKHRAEDEARARLQARRCEEEEKWEHQTAKRLKEEEEKLMLEGGKDKKSTGMKRAAEKIKKGAERALKATLRRKTSQEEAKAVANKCLQEEQESRAIIEEVKANKRADLERLEEERKKHEASLAIAEAQAREAANEKARVEQAKAIAAKQTIKTVIEEQSERDDEEDDDEDWEATEKARFLSEAKLEIEKKDKLKAKQKVKKEKARQKALEAKEKETARKAAFTAKQIRILEDVASPQDLLELEAEGADDDPELAQVLTDLQNVRECIAALEDRLDHVHRSEEKKLKRIEEKMLTYEYEWREEAMNDIVHYTEEELEDKDREAREAQEIIASLRKDNRKVRDHNRKLKKEMNETYTHNLRMEEFIKTAEIHMTKLHSIDEKELNKEERWEKIVKKFQKGIKNHEEALVFRTLAGDTARRMKELYERTEAKIVFKFQNECDDDNLVLELGAIALGESLGDDDEEKESMKVVKAFHGHHHEASAVETDSETDSDNED